MLSFCLLDAVDDFGGVRFEVAVGGVDLADGDAHLVTQLRLEQLRLLIAN